MSVTGSYSAIPAMGSDHKMAEVTKSDGQPMRFDPKVYKKGAEVPSGFGTLFTEKEFMQRWDEEVKSNEDKKMTVYEGLALIPGAKNMMWRIGDSPKLLNFDEYVKASDEMIRKTD
jgi:hypothetical protein